jgi:hypothetical protein
MAPKLDSNDAETRKLFEELERRIDKTPVRKW